MNDTKIRLALVGVGEIARAQHLPALAANSRFTLAATVDPHAAAQGDVPHFASLAEAMASGVALDAVALCTPPRIRPALAQAAIDAGLAVLLEKPPATGICTASLLTTRAAAAGVSLFAAWHSREAAGVAPARDHLFTRAIRAVRIEWRENVRQWHPGQEWLLGAGGFGAFDSGINALSILTAILPEPLTVESCHLAIPANREAPVAASLKLRHGAAPVEAHFDILHDGEPQWTITVETDAGELVLDKGGHALTIAGVAAACPQVSEYARLYRRFAGLIAARKSDVDLAPLMLVADACLIATRETVAPFHF